MVQLEYKVGPLTVNFRVLLEPKGFLRIIVLFVALLAFAITAGFNSTGSSNSVTCTSTNTSQNYTATLSFSYPYQPFNFFIAPSPIDVFIGNNTLCTGTGITTTHPLSGSAQFFVALGVLTIIYVVGAVLIYMLFITPELYLAKWLVIGDFFGTIFFGVIYVFASLAWSIGAAQLNTYVIDLLRAYATNCFQCDGTVAGAISPRTQTFTQAAVSAIFGWLASFIWLASIWFVYKDTTWHKDETGPLASLYRIAKGKDGGNQEQKEDAGGEEGEQ